jgi:hypothetical protein
MRGATDAGHKGPAAGRFPLLPTLVEWRRDPIAALSRMSTSTADISASRFGYPMRIVFYPALAGEVLMADAVSYTRPWLVTSTMRDGLGPMLFTATGVEAMAQRRLLAPEPVEGYITYLVAAGAVPRVDADKPENCPD